MEIGKLVISRRIYESFTIGDNVTVTVEDIRGGQARISIEAPKSVKILRSELHDRNQAYHKEMQADALSPMTEQEEAEYKPYHGGAR